MKYSYFPGCTLKYKAKELDLCARESAKALGHELEEIEEWQCCGGVFTLEKDELATKLASVRALMEAANKGQTLITVCSACHHVLKRVNLMMREGGPECDRINNYMKNDKPYRGEAKVIHYLEFLRDEVGFDNIKEAVRKAQSGADDGNLAEPVEAISSSDPTEPVKDTKIAPYYGCLLLRPSSQMAFDDPENPSIMENFIEAIGGKPVYYPYRNECCGAYTGVKNKDHAYRLSWEVKDSAAGFGAEKIITACPLCMYNLSQEKSIDIPVVYFTKVLAEALGQKITDSSENAVGGSECMASETGIAGVETEEMGGVGHECRSGNH